MGSTFPQAASDPRPAAISSSASAGGGARFAPAGDGVAMETWQLNEAMTKRCGVAPSAPATRQAPSKVGLLW